MGRNGSNEERTVEEMAQRLLVLSRTERLPAPPQRAAHAPSSVDDHAATAAEMRARWMRDEARQAEAAAEAARARVAVAEAEVKVAEVRPCSSMMLGSLRGCVACVAVALDALRVASKGIDARPKRRARTKAEDRRHVNMVDMAATSAAILTRRMFSGSVPPEVRAAEQCAARVESFAWFARERLRRLSFWGDLRFVFPPKERRPPYGEGELERSINAVRMHIEAEERESLAVEELSHALPRTNADVFRRLVAASERYQGLPDGAINEGGPLLVWMELAVSRRAELALDNDAPPFEESLCGFARESDRLPRTDHDGIARTALLSFGETVGRYTAADRKAKGIARATAREKERKRAG